jgi:hypothetical protein
VPAGRFEADRFRQLAGTAYDMAEKIFACHKSAEDHRTVCAGFLARGAAHNRTIRLAYALGQLDRLDRSGGMPLYSGYRDMAIANGVAPEDTALIACRSEPIIEPMRPEATSDIEP